MTEVTILAVLPKGGYSLSCRMCHRATIVSMPDSEDPGLLIYTFSGSMVVHTPWGQLIHDCSSSTIWHCARCSYQVSTEDETLVEGHVCSRKGVYVPMVICPMCASPMKIGRSSRPKPTSR